MDSIDQQAIAFSEVRDFFPAAFNARGAAHYLSLSESSIWDLAAKKKIEIRRQANRTFFLKASLDAYLASLPSNLEVAA